MFEVYLGEWYMASGETAEQAVSNSLSEAYNADLIGEDFPRISEKNFLESVDIYSPEL
jgi:hypothetical protein